MAKKRRNKRMRALCKDVLIILIALGFLGGGAMLFWIASFDIPDLESFSERKVAQSTKIYDRTGEILLYDVHEDIKRTLVLSEDISRHIKNATVAIEDAEFYDHFGIKPTAFLRAVIANLQSGSFSQGGSTLTQQVIKNSLLTTDKKISRKLKEWVLAVKLEREMSKDDILTLYLNETPYGGNIYGIEEASQAFFNKPASDIEIAEAAYLAALPQAPTFFSPYGNNKDQLEERKNLVLSRMQDLGFITDTEYEEAVVAEVEFQPRGELGILAPHFVFYVISQLEEQYGKKAIEERGFKVITTIDYELQQAAEAIVKKFALENSETFEAENAALVALDPRTGDIVTMVGSRDYFDEDIDGNFNVTIARRQPGSAFKPFAYATAFKKGFIPDSIVFDLETEFSTECTPEGEPKNSRDDAEDVCYMPENYTGEFVGPVSMRDALAQSMNIPAIKTLYLAGLNDTLRTARDMGIDGLGNVNQYGLTLVLGGGEVTPLEITSAYSVFANDGMRNEHRAILRIEDSDGNIVHESRTRPRRVLDAEVARMISDVLSDNDARAPLFGSNSLLHFANNDVASKTGTTNDFRDAWIVGYTPTVTVGAWVGNNDNTPMNAVSGLRVSPMWRAFMDVAIETLGDEEFITPRPYEEERLKPIMRGIWQGGEMYTIDKISGKLATEFTPEELREDRVVTEVHSILYWVNKNNPLGAAPRNPSAASQFEYWEHAVRNWVEENNIVEQDSSVIPTEYDTVHLPKNRPVLVVSGVTSGGRYSEYAPLTVSVNTSNGKVLSRVDVFVNNIFVGRSDRAPFTVTFIPSELTQITNTNTIRVVGYDNVLNKGEKEIIFTLN